MRFTPRTILIAAALPVLATTMLALQTTPATAQDGAAARRGSGPQTHTIVFKGGSLDDYLDVVRNAADNANIVELNAVSMVEFPAVEMRNVTIEQAVELIDGINTTVDGVQYHIDVDVNHGNNPMNPVFSVRVHSQSSSSRGGSPVVSHIWAVSHLLDKDGSAGSMLDALEAALTLSGSDHFQPRLRFHEETGLLMARAQINDVETIESVIEELQRQPRNVDAARNREMQDVRAQYAKAQSDLKAMQQECSALKNQNQAASVMVADSRSQYELLRSEYERMTIRIDRMAAEVVDLKVALQVTEAQLANTGNELQRYKDLYEKAKAGRN